MVVKADGSCHLPGSILMLPERDKFRFSEVVRITRVREPVYANLDCAEALHWIDLKCAGYKLSMDFAADIVLDRIEEGLPADCEAGLVVVKLQILGYQGGQFVELTVIVGVEEFGIQTSDCFVQGVARRQPLPALGICEGQGDSRQCQHDEEELIQR